MEKDNKHVPKPPAAPKPQQRRPTSRLVPHPPISRGREQAPRPSRRPKMSLLAHKIFPWERDSLRTRTNQKDEKERTTGSRPAPEVPRLNLDSIVDPEECRSSATKDPIDSIPVPEGVVGDRSMFSTYGRLPDIGHSPEKKLPPPPPPPPPPSLLADPVIEHDIPQPQRLASRRPLPTIHSIGNIVPVLPSPSPEELRLSPSCNERLAAVPDNTGLGLPRIVAKYMSKPLPKFQCDAKGLPGDVIPLSPEPPIDRPRELTTDIAEHRRSPLGDFIEDSDTHEAVMRRRHLPPIACQHPSLCRTPLPRFSPAPTDNSYYTSPEVELPSPTSPDSPLTEAEARRLQNLQRERDLHQAEIEKHFRHQEYLDRNMEELLESIEAEHKNLMSIMAENRKLEDEIARQKAELHETRIDAKNYEISCDMELTEYRSLANAHKNMKQKVFASQMSAISVQ